MTPFGGRLRAAHEGIVGDDGSVSPSGAAGLSGARSFVAWMARDEAVEARARIATATQLVSRGWWFEHGALVSWLDGTEAPLDGSPDAPIVATDLTYVSIDPPMTVHVHTASSARVTKDAPLPEATFEDPDAQ